MGARNREINSIRPWNTDILLSGQSRAPLRMFALEKRQISFFSRASPHLTIWVPYYSQAEDMQLHNVLHNIIPVYMYIAMDSREREGGGERESWEPRPAVLP